MPGPFPGALFAPTTDNSAEARDQLGQVRRSSTPLQVRNLSLPTHIKGAPSPEALLRPHATSGAADQAVLASIIRALMGQHAPIPASALAGGGGGMEAARGVSPVRGAVSDAGPFSGGGAPSGPQVPNIDIRDPDRLRRPPIILEPTTPAPVPTAPPIVLDEPRGPWDLRPGRGGPF